MLEQALTNVFARVALNAFALLVFIAGMKRIANRP